MGRIVRAILQVAAIVVNFIPGIGQIASLAISAALTVGASLLAPGNKPPRNSNENVDRLRANIDPRTPRKTAVGITALATDIRDEEFTDNQAFFHRFIVCASHKVQSIDEIWFDDKLAWSLAGGVQGEFVGYLAVTPVTEGSAANVINISPRMGSTRRYTGLAYVHLRYKLTGNDKKTDSPFAQSIPNRITIRGKAAHLPDPRNPAHNMLNQSTWTWNDNACRNPALVLLFYLLGWRINGKLAVGKGIPPDRIDLDSFITAANICDEMVTTEAGGTEPRYRCDGVWSEGDSPTTVIEMLKATMNADLDDVGGKLRLTIFHNDLALPVADFGDNDIIDAFTWQPLPPLDATFNVVRGLFTDAGNESLYQQIDYPEQRLDSPDGIDRIDTFNLPMVQSADQAQRLAQLRLQRQRFAGMFEAVFQASAWKVTKNSVIRLTFGQTGFVQKFFRVAEMEIRQDGTVPLKLREEDPAIYGDPPFTQPINPIFSSPFDPTRSPFVQAINRWRGEWLSSATYVLDDLVTGPGNAGWRYINATPTAGNPLPVWPATANAFWQNFTPPVDPPDIGVERGATRNEDGQNLLKNPITLDGATYVNGAGPIQANGRTEAQLVNGTFAAVVFSDWVPVRGGEKLYFSYIGYSDVSNPDSIRGGYNWLDRFGNIVANDLPESFLLGTEAVGRSNSKIKGQFGAVPADAIAVQMFVVRPTWGGVGSFFAYHPLVSRNEPAATVGAPAGTTVAGVEAGALVSQAANAQSSALSAQNTANAAAANAFAANTAIGIITSDGFLSIDEKPEIRKQRDAIIAEYPGIRASGVAGNVSVATYDTFYSDLISYLGGLALNSATNTAIDRGFFNAVFLNYYTARQAVLDGVAARGIGAFVAKQNLLFNARFALGLNGWDSVAGAWRFVRNSGGQFVEQPLGTGGTFILRANRPVFAGPGSQLVISLQGFANNAGPGQGIFADIEWRNGLNDTVLGFSSVINGNGAAILGNVPESNPAYNSQAVVAPSPTDGSGRVRGFVRIVSVGTVAYASGGHVALGVKVEAGATPSAISDEATDGAVLDNTFGRIRDPEAYNTQAILGPMNVTDLVPSYTVGASNVTVSLPAHVRKIATRTGPRTLSYGSASGVVAFNQPWWAFIDDPELTGFASPTVSFTGDPADLMFPGRYQIAAGIAPDSGGAGGSANPGGGMFPTFIP